MQLTRAQWQALESAISNVEDNLYRYKLQYQRDPNSKTGNDEPISNIILKLEAQLAELKEGL